MYASSSEAVHADPTAFLTTFFLSFKVFFILCFWNIRIFVLALDSFKTIRKARWNRTWSVCRAPMRRWRWRNRQFFCVHGVALVVSCFHVGFWKRGIWPRYTRRSMKSKLHRLISFIQTGAPSFPSSASEDLLIAFTMYIYSIWNAR